MVQEAYAIEMYSLDEDLSLFCVTAGAFPDGIIDAFQQLEQLHPSICERPFYGISFGSTSGQVTYKAAVAEAYQGEGRSYGCETLVIKEGSYHAITIYDFMKKLDNIPNAFKQLLAGTGFDKQCVCIEWYKSDKEVMCMVKVPPDRKK